MAVIPDGITTVLPTSVTYLTKILLTKPLRTYEALSQTYVTIEYSHVLGNAPTPTYSMEVGIELVCSPVSEVPSNALS